MIDKVITTFNIDLTDARSNFNTSGEMKDTQERKSSANAVKVSVRIQNLDRWMIAGYLTTGLSICSDHIGDHYLSNEQRIKKSSNFEPLIC